jgi:hypothetical protein
MKTKNLVYPLILTGLLFNQAVLGQSADYVDQKTFGTKCNVAFTTYVAQDDADYSRKMGYYRYSFCPEGSVVVTDYYGNYVTSGTWMVDDKLQVARFDMGASAETIYGDWSWLSGEWQLTEYSDYSMGMKRVDEKTGSTWEVIFQERMSY